MSLLTIRRTMCCVVCTVGCILGLTMCTRHGMFILQLLDNYSGTYSALMIGCLEVRVKGNPMQREA